MDLPTIPRAPETESINGASLADDMGGQYSPAMFELSVQREFSAAHAITINGQREPVHGHNWRVAVTVTGDSLDDNDLICDFHLVERKLDAVIAPFHNHSLNETPPFNRINPTAERVVEHIAKQISTGLPKGVRLVRVSVTEAPGCIATWVEQM
jgi:6-pyruvoyltetrahydropterin/6-carboxytetrahydropterin synthase